MIDKLKRINEEIINNTNDQEIKDKHLIIKKLLDDENCFFKMDISTAYAILRELKFNEIQLRIIYDDLIDSKNYKYDSEYLNKQFIKNGFKKLEDNNKKILLNIHNNKVNQTYEYTFETNKLKVVPNTDILFSVASIDNVTLFFINKDNNSTNSKEYDIPYRTYYDGLMKDPFKLVYHINKSIKIKTNDDYILEVTIM